MNKILLFFFIAVSLSACSQTGATGDQNLDNKAFAEKMKDPGVVIVDVRTQDEYQQGHIPNATLIDFYDPNFKSNLEKLDKSKTYLVYCAAGGRSSKACRILKEGGYKNVYNLEHGFNKWEGPSEK